eukprot:CAMPEP_0119126082 /NCGR_PEP_ID=MMETSP1310-20130426/5135_1 /TAXON_ID=464262 /ORGANISM="Genus nov. species nov., Strain RCC2339" /LENGTH=342 /DNA_ID=CAMNT_0007116211 /DNA_START=68 /DNA_END=1096 /DNA_ORIENTATION=-
MWRIGVILLLTYYTAALPIIGPDYEIYCTGNCSTNAEPAEMKGGFVLMGGSTDVDAAFHWMIDNAYGGDFVFLRSTGTDAYDPYVYEMGGVNSATTIILHNRDGANATDVVETMAKADMIFFAGGDQWTYYYNWKGTPLEDTILMRAEAGAPVGGTSAGCAVMGEFVYSAQFGSATSRASLRDPYTLDLTFGDNFLGHSFPGEYLRNVITDTHFAARDRMGRFLTFTARMKADVMTPKETIGIAVDERTAMLIDASGEASVVTDDAKGSVYMLFPASFPEKCEPSSDLEWSDVPTYRIRGNVTNAYDFNFDGIEGMTNVDGTTLYSLSASGGKLSSSKGSVY